MALLQIDLTGSKGLTNGLSQAVYKTSPEVHLNYAADEGEMAGGIYNPLMRPGYLYPANNSFLTLTTPTITGDFNSAFVDLDAGPLFGNEDTNIYVYDISFVVGPTTYTYDNMDGVKIEAVDPGGSLQIYDMIAYTVNEVEKIFFVNGDDIGIMAKDYQTIVQDYLSGTATGGDDLHSSLGLPVMIVADNGLMYILDSYAVHSLDGGATGGSSGTARMDILLFPGDMFKIVDGIDTRGKLFIAINTDIPGVSALDDDEQSDTFSSACGVYVWNRITTTVQMQDYVTIENCNRILRIWVGPDGGIYLMTIGTNGANQIRAYDGGKFVVVKELPFETKIMSRNSLLVAEGMTIWAGVDGFLYMGRMMSGTYAVFKMAQYATVSNNLTSVVMAFAGGTQFDSAAGYRTLRPSLTVAYKLSGSNAVMKRYFIYGVSTMTDTNGTGGAGFISPNPHVFIPAQGDVFTGVKLLPTMSTVRNVIIRCIPTSSAATTIATVKYYFNGSTSASVTKTVTMAEASKGYVSHALNKAYVNSIQMEIEWNTANTMGDNDFAPYLATVEYDATNTYSPEAD